MNKTLITDVTVSNKTVWITYKNKKGITYDGFTPYRTVKEAIDEAKKIMNYNIFENDFYVNSKTTFSIM
jgi:hypothetical protein